MKKKNVIEFIPELDTGGAQALVRDYARLIDYSKFNLYIVTLYPQKKGANVELIKQTKAKILSIYPAHIIPFQLIDHICPIYAISRLLLRIIKKTKADVVHVHVGILKCLVPIRKELKNIKLLYTCHSLPSRYFSGRNEMEYEPAKILIKDNQLQLIGLHNEMRDELNRMFGVDNSIVIYNGVDFERFRNVKEPKTSIRRSIGIPEDAFVMGHIGRFIEAKNHRFLIKIFRELTTRRSDAFLLLVGSGIMEQEIHHLISSYGLDDKVIHLKNRADIPRLLKAMDVLVFPSLFEGLPIAIVESQVAGIRTIVSDRINGECFFNEDLIVRSLNESPKVWVDAILDTRIKNFYNNDITIFDMNKVIRSLENVYSEKKSKILIIGKIHHNTYALVRSFGEAGMHVDLILYGCHDSYIGCSVYIHQLWYCDDTEAALYRVKELVSDEACRYIIISATDAMASLMDLHYDELKGHCHFFNAGDTGLLTHYMDKIIQARLAEKVGFAVPLTTSFRKGDTLSSSIFPCLVKPQASIDGGKRVAVCYSQKELDACAGRFADVGHILVQQYIEEGVEVEISGLAIGGKVVIPGYVIKKRKIKGGTTYSCTAPISQLDEKVVASSEELVKAMNYEGLFGIECIKSKGRYWFIEINLRSPATFYSLAVAGANLPLLYYQYYAESRPLAFDGTFREISSMVELKDFNFVKHRKVGLLKWLRQRRSAECRYFHSKTDKRACRRAYREYVIETVMNLLRKSLQLQIHSKEYKK